jgi:predicted  nucleic acid-binding Zn-ribbon protein
MKNFQEQLARISKTLSGLSKQVDKITKQIGKAAAPAGRKAKPGRKPSKKAPVKRAALKRTDTVLESVYTAITRSRSGLSIAQLQRKTDLGARQLSNALYKLTKKGLVHTQSRGIYVKS